MRSVKMRLRKVLMFLMAAALLAGIAACSNNDENNNGENNSDNEDVARLQFPELDRSNLGDNTVAEFDGGSVNGEEFAAFLGVQAFLNPQVPINDLEYRKESIKELIMEKILLDEVEDKS